MFNKIKQLFEWLKQKWEWRGMAIVTKEDWQKNGRRLLKDLKNNTDMKEAVKILTQMWLSYGYLLYEFDRLDNLPSEQTQELVKELWKIRKLLEQNGMDLYWSNRESMIKRHNAGNDE
jgi:hypothetical protein